MLNVYKIGFIGCGRNARELHAPLLQAHSRFEIYCGYNRNEDTMRAFCDEYNAAPCCATEEFFQLKPDIALILTPNHTHADLTCQCLNQGINVLVTKPWVISLAEADRVLGTAEKTGCHVYEFLPMQFENDLLTLRGLLDKHAIGTVYRIQRIETTFGRRIDWQTQTSCGGGYLNNWGPHMLAQAISLAQGEVQSVCGYMRQIINPGDAEDMFYSMMKTSANELITVEYDIMTDRAPQWIIQGSHGTIYANKGEVRIHRVTQPPTINARTYRDTVEVSEEILHYEPADRGIIYTALADALDGTNPFPVTPAFSRKVTGIIEYIRASSQYNSMLRMDK